jgi:hypothetical protein
VIDEQHPNCRSNVCTHFCHLPLTAAIHHIHQIVLFGLARRAALHSTQITPYAFGVERHPSPPHTNPQRSDEFRPVWRILPLSGLRVRRVQVRIGVNTTTKQNHCIQLLQEREGRHCRTDPPPARAPHCQSVVAQCTRPTAQRRGKTC